MGLVDSILCGRVGNHRLTKDGRDLFLDIDSYQKSQGSEETCATNDWGKNPSGLMINIQGGKNTSLTNGTKE